MEITRQTHGDILLLKLSGRLDATWSGPVQAAISAGIRSGAHRIHLDMGEVAYLSSAGIGVLLTAFKEIESIHGELSIPRCSEAVRQVLDLAGLGNLLVETSIFPTASVASTEPSRKYESAHGVFDCYSLGEFPAQRFKLYGQPEHLPRAAFASDEKVEFPTGSLGFGIGAFGTGFDDCQARFGEALAVGGAGVYLPTDGSSEPDYLLSEGSLVPTLRLLYGLSAHGSFSRLLRFESKTEGGRIGMEEIALTALESTGSPLVVLALVAETASLVGAALQRSPVQPDAPSLFHFPGVRDWFTFTAERAYIGGVSLVVGIVGREMPERLISFVRPIGKNPEPRGHFHAAAFGYRPVPKGKIDLQETVIGLFQNQHLQGLLHLLADRRDVHGAGESEFFRGACWVSPLEMGAA